MSILNFNYFLICILRISYIKSKITNQEDRLEAVVKLNKFEQVSKYVCIPGMDKKFNKDNQIRSMRRPRYCEMGEIETETLKR